MYAGQAYNCDAMYAGQAYNYDAMYAGIEPGLMLEATYKPQRSIINLLSALIRTRAFYISEVCSIVRLLDSIVFTFMQFVPTWFPW